MFCVICRSCSHAIQMLYMLPVAEYLNKSGINKCRTYFRRDVPIATLLLV